MTFFKKEDPSQNKNTADSNPPCSFHIGDKVIDKDGNNATIAEMFEWDMKDYDEEKQEFFSLDMANKVKLKYDSEYTKIVDFTGIRKGVNAEKKTVKHILETIYSIDTSTMTEEKMGRLYTVMNLYADFYKNNKIPLRSRRFSNREEQEFSREFDRNTDCFNSIFVNLKIELPANRIKLIYEQFGVIQLREVNSRTLTLGCGSEPLLYGSSIEGYKEKHAHQNEITMSPELGFNPTVVAYFEGKFKFAENYFEKVVFEGFFKRKIADIIEDLNEVKRILAPEGKVSFVAEGKGSKTYSKEQIDLIIKHFKEIPQFDIITSDLSLETDDTEKIAPKFF